jgi:hypothetical protein
LGPAALAVSSTLSAARTASEKIRDDRDMEAPVVIRGLNCDLQYRWRGADIPATRGRNKVRTSGVYDGGWGHPSALTARPARLA